jgi:DNA-binding winged helix-turn-helix (wHTH) protein
MRQAIGIDAEMLGAITTPSAISLRRHASRYAITPEAFRFLALLFSHYATLHAAIRQIAAITPHRRFH